VLRQKPYPGAIGLAGLGRVMARVTGLARIKTKTSPRVGFILIPQPGLS
jgi:hypothetical protein